MFDSGSVLTLERALDSASRGVISLEQFPVHSDFTFAVGLEGFLLVCPHCHIRLGDFRALLREVAAIDPLHPFALVRVIQEVGRQQGFLLLFSEGEPDSQQRASGRLNRSEWPDLQVAFCPSRQLYSTASRL